jgi:3D (Asp-Asp-Asp) domain-containing protein
MIMRRKLAAVCIALILLSADASAKEFEEPEVIRCTCYCEHGKTATGIKTRYGIISGKKEWLGCVAELHRINEDGSIGQFIGFFEFKDTGAGMDSDGDGIGDTIKNGKSVDVWVDTLEEAYMWRDAYGDYVYMKIIKGKG